MNIANIPKELQPTVNETIFGFGLTSDLIEAIVRDCAKVCKKWAKERELYT